ncbi:MAG: class D sortase [Candidatus Saccharibacteria bacterium]|nr:class D sortase [Candidatus Saccharibacteria bacterium]
MNPQNATGGSDNAPDETSEHNAAADLIRQKLANLYAQEPDAGSESAEAQAAGTHRSKHQQYIYDLSQSGKSATEIQTAWHEYYQALSDQEKHEVWREFYQNQRPANDSKAKLIHTPVAPEPQPIIQPGYYHEEKFVSSMPVPAKKSRLEDLKTVAEIRKQLLQKVKTRPSPKATQHVKSLLFGLGVGSIVIVIMLMGFFNERFIAPFITPSRTVSSTPIIVSDSTTVSDPIPKVIIPKINVEIPVVYDLGTTEESAIQNALEDGVVHYDNTPQPGQEGNVVVFGHSSNNIFNEGKYKFAFVLLSRLEPGDLFYLTKDGTRYAYKIYDKRIVKPTAIEVLGPTDKPDTATLITCDPPGTTLNRLVVIGEQISPDANANVAVAPSQPTVAEVPAVIPSNAPSLWQRLTSWL